MLKVYGIPSCSVVQRACRWLDEEQIDYEVVDIGARRPVITKLTEWVVTLSPHELRDTDGKAYRALPAEKSTWSAPQWIAAFAFNPDLLRHPIFEREGRPVMVGFAGSDDELRAKLRPDQRDGGRSGPSS